MKLSMKQIEFRTEAVRVHDCSRQYSSRVYVSTVRMSVDYYHREVDSIHIVSRQVTLSPYPDSFIDRGENSYLEQEYFLNKFRLEILL